MLVVLSLLLALALPPGQPASRAGNVPPAADYEAALTALLRQVVTPEGRVRYDLLRGPLRHDLRRVLKAVEDYDRARLTTDAQKLAFWINAYNVQMLQSVVAHPSATNVVEGAWADVFFKTPFRTAGLALTLDDIEHTLLRRQGRTPALRALQPARLDPRIHVGLNCAAVSCPALRAEAFTAARLEAQLNAAMRDFTASPSHFRRSGEAFVLSSLLDWFGTDFDAAGLPAGDYLLRFMPPERPHYALWRGLLQGRTSAALKAHPAVRFAYDWSVNAAR